METITCHSCGHLSPAELSFCENCDIQVKCLNKDCKNLLKAGKTLCLHCGEPIKDMQQKPQSNRFIRHIDRKSQHSFTEHIEIDMTDHAVDSLAPFITGQIVPPNYDYQPPPKIKTINEKQLPLFENGNNKNNSENNEIDSDIEIPAKTSQPLEKDSNGAYEFFRKDDDKLVLKVKDFKGINWKEQQRRFILLYTGAYVYYFQTPVPADIKHYKKAAEAAAIYDFRNFNGYLRTIINEFFLSLNSGYELNPEGEAEVRKIIKEINNPAVSIGDKYWERPVSAPPGKVSRISKDDLKKIESWVPEDIDLGKLKVGDIDKGVDYVIVALWIITEKLDKEKAIHWSVAYTYLKEKFTTISVSRDAFRKASISSSAAEYIEQTQEGLLYLKSDGIKRVEKLIEGN